MSGSHVFCVFTVPCASHCSVQILRRGMPPGGGGEVLFSCPVRKVLKPVQLTDPGKIKRIRGMAYPLRWILSLLLPRGVNNSTCWHYLHLRQQSHKSQGIRDDGVATCLDEDWGAGAGIIALCSVVKCFFCVLWGKITLCTSVLNFRMFQLTVSCFADEGNCGIKSFVLLIMSHS